MLRIQAETTVLASGPLPRPLVVDITEQLEEQARLTAGDILKELITLNSMLTYKETALYLVDLIAKLKQDIEAL